MKYYAIQKSNTLTHHGIKGMRWGVRRFQDYDGHRIGSKKRNRNSSGYSGYSSKKASSSAKSLNKKGKYYHRYTTNGLLTKYHVEEVPEDYAKANLIKTGEHGYYAQVKRVNANKNVLKSKEFETTKFELEKEGFKTNTTFSQSSRIDFHKTYKTNDGEVFVSGDIRIGSESPKDFVKKMDNLVSSVQKNKTGITEGIAKKLYDDYEEYTAPNSVSRDQFKKGLKLTYISKNTFFDSGSGITTVAFKDTSKMWGNSTCTAEIGNDFKVHRAYIEEY